MSLLRQRATDVSVLSTRSERRPAAARLRFVRAMRSRSELELKVPLPHASVDWGRTKLATELIANSTMTNAAVRRVLRPDREDAVVVWLRGSDMRWVALV